MNATAIGAVIEQRRQTHGDWNFAAPLAAELKTVLAKWLGRRDIHQQKPLLPQQREALDMILAKVARIVSGDPGHPDHWNDVAGYAMLGLGSPMVAEMTLAAIISASLSRSARWHKGGIDEWSVADWAVALAGEAG